MHPGLLTLSLSLCLLVTSLPYGLAQAQESPAPQAPAPLKVDFDALELGKLPADMMVIDGEFEVAASADGKGKVLRMKPEPLTDGTVLMGKSLKTGGTVSARIQAMGSKRRHPKFGLSIGGTSGFRLRLVPSEKLAEITLGDERQTTTELADWKSGSWQELELSVLKQADGKWLVEGRFWAEGGTRPEKAQITHTTETAPPSGKAGVVAAPFSGTEILFDNVSIVPAAAAEEPAKTP